MLLLFCLFTRPHTAAPSRAPGERTEFYACCELSSHRSAKKNLLLFYTAFPSLPPLTAAALGFSVALLANVE